MDICKILVDKVMPDVNIYLPTDMFFKLRKASNMSKMVQEALTLLWDTREMENKQKKG